MVLSDRLKKERDDLKVKCDELSARLGTALMGKAYFRAPMTTPKQGKSKKTRDTEPNSEDKSEEVAGEEEAQGGDVGGEPDDENTAVGTLNREVPTLKQGV